MTKELQMIDNVCFIGAPLGHGAGIIGCEEAPRYIDQSGIAEELGTSWIHIPTTNDDDTYDQIIKHNRLLAQVVKDCVKRGDFPLVIGGDHSIAAGTWQGVAQGLKKSVGLIWIDAHLDAHTPDTSPSACYHGMSVAALLGYGDPAFCFPLNPKPTLKPENLCYIGARSFETEELALLNDLGVKISFMDEVHERGIANVLNDAVEHVTKEAAVFGISLDVDYFDADLMPAVGTPSPFGGDPYQLLRALDPVTSHPRFKALEIVEYNPSLDRKDQGLQVLKDCIKGFLHSGGG